MKKRLLSCLAATMILLVCASCSAQTTAQAATEKRSMYFFGTFDTMITIIGYAPSQEAFDAVTARAQERFTQLHQIFDQYNEYEGISNLYVVNRDAAQAPVTVPEELMALLVYAKQKQAELHDTVNIAMGSVLSLWHDARENAETDPEHAALPDMDALKAAAEHTSIDDVVLDEANRTVFFADPLLKLDLGAVAKGYATELVAQEMLASEMPNFIINAGGNVRVGQPPLDGRKTWGISIQDPNASATAVDQSMETLYLNNLSVVTSGDYQRYYFVDGVRMHHIISPKTLMPATENRSVTIVTESSELADILSTAVFMMPYEEGRAFVDALPGVEAMWMTENGDIYLTDALLAMSKTGGASAR